MEPTEAAWLAGIIDGAGTFALGDEAPNPSASVTIEHASPPVLAQIERLFAARSVKYRVSPPARKVRSRRLSVRNYGSLVRLIDDVAPYLVGQRLPADQLRAFAANAARRRSRRPVPPDSLTRRD